MDNRNFIDFTAFDSPHEITASNRNVLPALGKGTLKIVTTVKNQRLYKKLKDVWYVP